MADHSACEQVYAVRDWYDGPRSGIADFRGAPHHFRSLYLDTDAWDPDEDRFELVPVTRDMVASALEEDAIFRRWETARQAGAVPEASEISPAEFGALPEERARFAELQAVFAPYEAPGHADAIVVRGEFQPGCKDVRWLETSSPAA